MTTRALMQAAAVLCTATACMAQTQSNLSERALREYQAKQFTEAERDLRELIAREPSNIYAQFYLGQTLFMQEKYANATAPFEKARDLEKAGTTLSADQHRILTDQLVIAYGVSGQLGKTHALLDEAIRSDPGYPMNYYNLACAFAEENNKPKMLANLDLAFQRKSSMLAGEQMPDPRIDSSFQKYRGDADFVELMKKIGLK